MADGVFNIAKGNVAEYAVRVNGNDPTNSALIVALCTGTETDATLKDFDDLSAVLAGNLAEATFTNYARKTVTSITVTTDDTNDRKDIDFADQTWSSAGNGVNSTLTRLLICYDSDTTGGTDANIIPCTYHDFSVTTDGSDLTANLNSQGFYSAGE